ncbi:hypothetical protein [Maribacter antarcticus]|nr:hypothetical protein [Maribacter antarcticus]
MNSKINQVIGIAEFIRNKYELKANFVASYYAVSNKASLFYVL